MIPFDSSKFKKKKKKKLDAPRKKEIKLSYAVYSADGELSFTVALMGTSE